MTKPCNYILIAIIAFALHRAALPQDFAFVKGNGNGEFAVPLFGTQGIASPTNQPGAVQKAVAWRDLSGNLWVFGGDGPQSGGVGYDALWKFNTSTKLWTWMKGGNGGGAPAVRGSMGVAASTNNPGGRLSCMSWTDKNGDLWLFGGLGPSLGGRVNDLWRYNIASNNWAWMKGGTISWQQSVYGTQGIPNPANTPGYRESGATWTDNAGNLWLFGGNNGPNDFWKYDVTSNNWTWMAGGPATNQYGIYGSQGVASNTNYPGARSAAATATDASGNFWLFGGGGNGASTSGVLNDLWKFDPTTNRWTWVKGSNEAGALGVYGTQGAEAAPNTPGCRSSAVSYCDSSGKFWLVGGADVSFRNDLWRFNPATSNWTWMKGASTTNQDAVYGSPDTPAPANTPAAVCVAVGANDNSGNLWYFGGLGKSGTYGQLWRFNVVAANWAWVKGIYGLDQSGDPGTLGIPAPANQPGARSLAAAWMSDSATFWAFGGQGHDSTTFGILSDLWKYDASSGNWTWMKGSISFNSSGNYGSLGVPATTNAPGARYGAATWTDHVSNLWLFGGYGIAAGTTSGNLNDLWRFNIPTGAWTWIGGSNSLNQSGNPGTIGVPAPSNQPGGRYTTATFTDLAGNLWLFGGNQNNELWKYDVSSNVWTWMKGGGANGVYGTPGIPNPANTPGRRLYPVSWTDSSGNFWLFGGRANGPAISGDMKDLWKFDPATNNWTWMKGSNVPGDGGVYGTKGLASASNSPGAREAAISYLDTQGNLCLFGGLGYDGVGSPNGNLNDAWKYQISTGMWTWTKGSNSSEQYTILGTSNSSNMPGSRNLMCCSQYRSAIYFLGGNGKSQASYGFLNELWRVDFPASADPDWMNLPF